MNFRVWKSPRNLFLKMGMNPVENNYGKSLEISRELEVSDV